jgi:hypothetical protein
MESYERRRLTDHWIASAGRGRVRVALYALLIVTAVAATALADEPVSAVASNQGAMRAYIDPETGTLTAPQRGEVVSLPPQVGRRVSAPAVVPGASAAGGVKMQVGDRLLTSMIGQVRPDGDLTVECLPNRPQLDER